MTAITRLHQRTAVSYLLRTYYEFMDQQYDMVNISEWFTMYTTYIQLYLIIQKIYSCTCINNVCKFKYKQYHGNNNKFSRITY